MSFSRLGLTLLACPQRMLPLKRESIHGTGRNKTWQICGANCVPWVPCSIGGGKLSPVIPIITSGPSGFSGNCFCMDWHTGRNPRWIGARIATPPWHASRSGERTGIASDVVRLLRSETWSNGSSEQPGMLMNCCIMIKWIGRNGFVCCKPTGLAGRKGRQSFSRLKMVIPWKYLPPDRIRYGEQPLWCWHPSIPWCKASRHRSKNK